MPAQRTVPYHACLAGKANTYAAYTLAAAGLGPAWHLDQVEVFHPGLQKTFTFPCQDWLEATKEKGIDGCKRLLKSGQAAAKGGAAACWCTWRADECNP